MITLSGQYRISKNDVLVFDLDGTLVETDYANFLAYKSSIEIVIGRESPIVYDSKERFTRTSLKKCLHLTSNEIIKIIATKERIYRHYLCVTKLNKEIFDILQTYQKTNDCILLTNSCKERAVITLNFHNLTDYFSHMIFSNSKMCFNKYKEAISLLRLRPESMIVYENDEQQIYNARKCGITVVNRIPHT